MNNPIGCFASRVDGEKLCWNDTSFETMSGSMKKVVAIKNVDAWLNTAVRQTKGRHTLDHDATTRIEGVLDLGAGTQKLGGAINQADGLCFLTRERYLIAG